MNDISCVPLTTVGQLISSLSNGVYFDTEQFSVKGISNIWVKPIYELAPQIDNIRQTYVDLVSAKQFEKAVDFMLNEIYEHSKILAQKTNIPFEDKTDIAYLFEKLRGDKVIDAEEWRRLTILQMAMDGLDIEVYEYGASIKPNELSYLTEFLDIIRTILARNNTYVGTYVGVSMCANMGVTTYFDFYAFQSANTIFTATTGTLVINAACVAGNALVNWVNKGGNSVSVIGGNSVSVTNFQAG